VQSLLPGGSGEGLVMVRCPECLKLMADSTAAIMTHYRRLHPGARAPVNTGPAVPRQPADEADLYARDLARPRAVVSGVRRLSKRQNERSRGRRDF